MNDRPDDPEDGTCLNCDEFRGKTSSGGFRRVCEHCGAAHGPMPGSVAAPRLSPAEAAAADQALRHAIYGSPENRAVVNR